MVPIIRGRLPSAHSSQETLCSSIPDANRYRLMSNWICDQLQLITPPEVIAHMWNEIHSHDTVSYTTIYRALQHGLLPNCSRKKNLSRHCK